MLQTTYVVKGYFWPIHSYVFSLLFPVGPAYPPNQPMPYSQAAYNPGQPAYPLHPPTYPQPNAPSSHADFRAQPAYNPDYVAPPTTG